MMYQKVSTEVLSLVYLGIRKSFHTIKKIQREKRKRLTPFFGDFDINNY